MLIYEMLFITEFCEKAKLKVLASKKTLTGDSVWFLTQDGVEGSIKAAKISSSKDSIMVNFAEAGRQIHLGFSLNLELVDMNIGDWEPDQQAEKDLFEARIRSYCPDKQD